MLSAEVSFNYYCHISHHFHVMHSTLFCTLTKGRQLPDMRSLVSALTGRLKEPSIPWRGSSSVAV